MLLAPLPEDDIVRVEALRSLQLLDTAPERCFDHLVSLARNLLGTPIGLISLVDADRQWFKSKQGLDVPETARDISFCGHAILQDDPFIVPDARVDPRFADNPFVTEAPHIRFYAGQPLKGPTGHPLGTLCVIDQTPHEMGTADIQILQLLGHIVELTISMKEKQKSRKVFSQDDTESIKKILSSAHEKRE